MPYCPKCGVENPPSARFCDQCGATLIPVPASAPIPSPSVAPAPRPVQPIAPPPRPAATVAAPLSAGPIVCPQCGASAIPGEAFCDNCGAPLSAPAPAAAVVPPPVPAAGLAPQPVYHAPQPAAPTFTPPPAASPAPVVAPTRAALAPAQLVLDDGSTLALPNKAEAIIGRADPVSNFTPDVDLSAHNAINTGVGRRHARLFVQQGQLMVEDLDSTNGSFLNGSQLAARQPQPIRANDELRLGSLRVRLSL